MMSGRAVPQGTAFHFRNGIVRKGITGRGVRESAFVRTVHEEGVRADLA